MSGDMKHTIRPGHCPKCQAKLKYETDSESYDGGKMFSTTCSKCDTKLQEHYGEVFLGFSIPDSDGNYTGEMEFLAPVSPLQATAPDLLEICQKMIRSWDNPTVASVRMRCDTIVAMRKIITKATTEEAARDDDTVESQIAGDTTK